MTAQDFIQSELKALPVKLGLGLLDDKDELLKEITRLTLSKKFRKYSVSQDPMEHIKASIEANVKLGEPIKFTLPFGAYKLWRLQQSPEADWAELFSMMYFTQWLKPICEIYEPGVWFDFFSDDVIIPRMNNILKEDLVTYKGSFEALLKFIKPYQPDNMQMTLTRVIDQYDSQQAFEKDYENQLAQLKSSLKDGLPELSDQEKAMIEFNVKATPAQLKDPKWREKVMLIHNSYAAVGGRRPHYRPIEQRKIMVVCTPLWGMLCVGSTKASTVKFWVGAGVLKKQDETFRPLIMSPSQLEKSKYEIQQIDIKGLSSKNFDSIAVLA